MKRNSIRENYFGHHCKKKKSEKDLLMVHRPFDYVSVQLKRNVPKAQIDERILYWYGKGRTLLDHPFMPNTYSKLINYFIAHDLFFLKYSQIQILFGFSLVQFFPVKYMKKL